jgi:hypothetical protein
LSQIEAYRVAATLGLNVRESMAGVGEFIKGLRDALAAQKQILAAQADINAALAASTGAAKGFADEMSRAAAAAKAMAGYGGAGGGRGGYGGPPALTGPSREALPPPRSAMPLLGYNGGGGHGGGNGGGGADEPFFPPNEPVPLNWPRVRRPGGGFDSLMAGVGLQYAGRETLGAVGGVFDAGAEAQSLAAKMRSTAGFDAARVIRAQQQARDLVSSVPGLYYREAMELILQTASFTGNVDSALALTPTLARDAQVLSQYGSGGAVKQIEDAAKAGELTGLTTKSGQINIPKLVNFVDRLTAVDIASAGTLDIGKYLTGIRQFGVGADSASLDFLTATMPAYMKIMGQSKTGTAFSSLLQSLSTLPPNTQNQQFMKEQRRLGLRGADGGILHGDILRTDPNEWFQGFMLPKMLAHGIVSATDQTREMYRLFPRQTMARVGAAAIFDEGIINKEAERNRAQIAMGTAPFDALLRDSVQNQVRAFSAALNLMGVTLADPAMGRATESLRGLTSAMLGFSGIAKDHPSIAAGGLTAAAGLGGAAYLTGSLLTIGFFTKKVYDVAAAFAAFAPGTSAALGMTGLYGALSALAAVSLTGAGIGGGNAGTFRAGKGHVYDLRQPDSEPIGAIYDWIDKRLQDLGIEGRPAPTPTVIVKNYIDGKEVGGHLVKSIVHAAAGAENSTGGSDYRRMAPPPGNN